ncbi:hypothetical protein DVS77_00920 [Mycolicibacterium moriokaense]|nr:hypothetical protein DVS77_00920 [Mycolicibacterium moriokaense]
MSALVTEIRRPLRVEVRGRDGVGRATVAAALAGAGVSVADDECADVRVVDVNVVVVAEALKPEDKAMIGVGPTVVVLTKADLAGFGAGGPIAVADARAAAIQALTGVPTVAMVGLLAVAALDDGLIAALRALTAEPADLTSTDAFLSCEHSVPRDVRVRLLEMLDLFGIAHGVLALRQGTEPAALPDVLRQLSQIDRVTARIAAAGAEVRYRRVNSALAALRTMAAGGVPALAGFLAGDDAVLAVMSSAVDVVEAAGLTVDAADDPAAHLRRAVHWQRYSRGPVNRLHRQCAADISRGSLRLLRRAEAR